MRKVHWGTPSRSQHYQVPRKVLPLFRGSLLAGGAVLVLLLLGDVVGLSRPVSPGRLSAKHGLYDSRCSECHAAFSGASDVRCQRCHDPASAGRFTNRGHVFFGSLDPARAAAAPRVACALCHVEHRGAAVALQPVDEAHCTACHGDASQFKEKPFNSFRHHPEFGVLRRQERARPGIIFSHLTHCTGKGNKRGYILTDRKLDDPEQTCGECHHLAPGGEDFEPLSYEAHCERCHRGDLAKMDPVPAREIDSFGDLELSLDEATLQSWNVSDSDFEDEAGQVLKVKVSHRDGWIQHNTLKLWAQLDPAGFAAERARVKARQDRLERRLALASPTALVAEEGLSGRVATLESEIAYINERLRAQPSAQDPSAGLLRLDQVAEAAAAAEDPAGRAEAQELVRRGAALRSQGFAPVPLSRAEVDARRTELLGVLDAIEKADPSRAGQVAELRQRLGQLEPGESSQDLLVRLRDQREEVLRRLRDEISLKKSGALPPSETLLAAERQAIRAALDVAQRRAAELDRVPIATDTLTSGDAQRKQQALLALTKGCRYCHDISPVGAMAPVHAAESVLWRARFTHRDHLTQGGTCRSCHTSQTAQPPWSIETSDDATEINFRGIDSCRECHRPGRASAGCQTCHDYHPPAQP